MGDVLCVGVDVGVDVHMGVGVGGCVCRLCFVGVVVFGVGFGVGCFVGGVVVLLSSCWGVVFFLSRLVP